MPMTRFRGALGAAALTALSTSAFAHASIETTEAPANAAYKGIVRVPPGYKGEPTRTLRIDIPEGVIDVKPIPKAGWTPTTSRAAAPTVKVAQAAAARQVYKVGSIVIEAPWSRATPGGAKVAGGYMRVTNTGPEPDRLLGGAVPISGRFEIHEASRQGDVMRMRPLEQGLEIKPGQTVELKPGGHHLMFVDLKQPLKEGETIKGTLVFEKAGPVAVAYTVRSIGARGAGHEHHH